jgi:hypothetical protein
MYSDRERLTRFVLDSERLANPQMPTKEQATARPGATREVKPRFRSSCNGQFVSPWTIEL